jgi:hypothetical protein
MEYRAATLADVFALAAPRLPAAIAKALHVQAFRSEMVAGVDAGGLAAILGFYPLGVTDRGEDAFELWTFSRPDLPPRSVLALVRRVRSTLAGLAHSGGVAVIAHVKPGHEPGQRLCVMAGMESLGLDGGNEAFLWRSAHG